MASQLLCKAIDLWQAKAGTFTGRLRRKERVECSPKSDIVHAFASISDGEQHILPRLDLGVTRCISVVEGSVCHLDRELATARHRVAGVDCQVQDGRLKF